MPAKSRLVEFNEFCVAAGESARATLITLCNELRSGEHRRKTKALSGPAASGKAKTKELHAHILECARVDRARDVCDTETGGVLAFFPSPYPGYQPHVKGNEM